MKTVLLFAFMSILANFMWCGKNYDEPKIEFGPLQGEWNVSTITETDYIPNNLTYIAERKVTYNPGEKIIYFEEDSGVYKEFENG
ncbi:MAG TPA: hypothetical protein VK927_06770, partial [Adhaeribacter sp.]|nr:hypothetical protein [Adhaeribacter sp.]